MRWIFVAMLMLPGVALAQDCPPGTWREAAPLPAKRTEVVAASDGQAIYVAGGMGMDGATDVLTVYRYDPAPNEWTPVGKLDEAVNHAGLAVADGKLYVVGGYGGPRNAPTARVSVIDLSTGTLGEAAPMPAPRGALAVAVLDGRIHAIGGRTDKSVATHEVYDPATDSWAAAAPMGVPRNHLAAAAFGGRLYVFGGRDESTFLLDAAEMYDPATDSWTAVAPLPTGRSGIAAAVQDGRIVVFGGEVQGESRHTFADAEAFDPAAGTWTALAPMPTARHGLGVSAAGDDIYVVSGGPQPGLTVSDVNEVLCGAE